MKISLHQAKPLDEGYVEIWDLPRLQPHMGPLFLHNPPPKALPYT
jgi:hypothetical protein